MIDHLWQSTLFAALIWLITARLPHHRAAIRYRLWLAASAKFLVPLALLTRAGRMLGWREPAATVVADWSAPLERALSPTTLASAPVVVAAFDLRWALLAIWTLGVVMVLFSWRVSSRDVRRALAQATPMPPGSFGLPHWLRMLSTPALYEPAVVGVWRPRLLLPEGIATLLSTPELDAVLAHELCHLRRRDNLAAAFHLLVEAIFWFHPAVWFIERRLVEERERACDECVLDAGTDARIYAEGILSICRSYTESEWLCAPGVSGAHLQQRIEAIMRNDRTLSLTRWQKTVLAAVALVVIGWPLGIGVMRAPTLAAQSERVTFDASGPAFDVVSIKRNVTGQPTPGGDGYMRGGVYRAVNFQVVQMIIGAARLQRPQVVGGPDWIRTDSWDITAKLDHDWELVNNRPAPSMFAIVRTMLADRFKLSAHYESREMPAYALVLARNDGRWGPSLHKAAIDCRTLDYSKPPSELELPHGFCGGIKFSTGSAIGQGATMAQLAKNLVGLGRFVIDRTGINEPVDLELTWVPGIRPAAAVEGPPQDPVFGDGVSLFTALPEQLGLKLEPIKTTVEVLVIDHIERPAED